MSLSEEFFGFCAAGELRFQRCGDCGRWRHPPRLLCAGCGSAAWSWERSARRGVIYSWTVTHQAMSPVFADRVPYAIVVTELDEGPRLVSGVHDLPLDELRLGLPVEVGFDVESEHVGRPFVRPAEG